MSQLVTRDQHRSWLDDPEHGVVPSRRPAGRRRKSTIKWHRLIVWALLLIITIVGYLVEVTAASRSFSDAGGIIFVLGVILLVGMAINPLLKALLHHRKHD